MVMNLIGTCMGTYFSKKSDKNFVTFSCAGIVQDIKVAEDYSNFAQVGHKYFIECSPRQFEDKAFFAFKVGSEVQA